MLPFAASAETSIPEGYISIYTIEDLDNVRNDPNGKYILMKDLDLEGINWVPISGFYSTFDGNGHVIVNLTVSGEGYGGLFGIIDYYAKIQNLGIVNCMINVTGFAGGIAGNARMNPLAVFTTEIENCFVSGTIHSEEEIVGGLVGSLGSSTIAMQSGRLNVVNCYSMAQVNSSSEGNGAGGLLGAQLDQLTCNMSNSYFGGSSTSFAIGLCSSLRTSSVFHLDTSVSEGHAYLTPTSVSTALTDAQMRQQTSFAGFDFGETGPWVMPSEGYPILKAFARTVAFDANGGEGAPEAQVNLRHEPLTLSTTVPTKEGFYFVGWASEAVRHMRPAMHTRQMRILH